MSMFVAGNEATANALFWCLYHIVKDPSLGEELENQSSSINPRTAEDVARVPHVEEETPEDSPPRTDPPPA